MFMVKCELFQQTKSHEHVHWRSSARSALPGLSEETERQNGMTIMYIFLAFYVCYLQEPCDLRVVAKYLVN